MCVLHTYQAKGVRLARSRGKWYTVSFFFFYDISLTTVFLCICNGFPCPFEHFSDNLKQCLPLLTACSIFPYSIFPFSIFHFTYIVSHSSCSFIVVISIVDMSFLWFLWLSRIRYKCFMSPRPSPSPLVPRPLLTRNCVLIWFDGLCALIVASCFIW